MASLPMGATYNIATGLSGAKAITAVTNAAEAVASSVAHGFVAGDYLLFGSGWARLNQRVVRVKTVTADSFVLEAFDTTNTAMFMPGSGAGTAQKITGWTPIVQVLKGDITGGDVKTVTYQYLESEQESTLSNGFGATKIDMELDADSNTTAGYAALKAVSETDAITALRVNLRSGAVLVFSGRASLNENIALVKDQINIVKASFNTANRVSRY